MKRKKSNIWSIAAFLFFFLATIILFRHVAGKRIEPEPCVYGPFPTDYVEEVPEEAE